MLLVQISDIHCGPQFRAQIFRSAAKEINAMSPDMVLVTGDLTEDGFISQFQTAASELKKLKARRIVCVSGNHDYRSTGYLLFRQFFPFTQVSEVEDSIVIVLSSAHPTETTARWVTDRTSGSKRRWQNTRTESRL